MDYVARHWKPDTQTVIGQILGAALEKCSVDVHVAYARSAGQPSMQQWEFRLKEAEAAHKADLRCRYNLGAFSSTVFQVPLLSLMDQFSEAELRADLALDQKLAKVLCASESAPSKQ